MRNLFDILNEKFSKFYDPSEHLALDEVIVKHKGRVIFQQYTPKKQTFWDQNLQTVWWDWIRVWYDSLFRQRQTTHCATPDRNSRDSVGIDKEITRTSPRTVCGRLLLLPGLIQWLGHETNLLLWHCPTQQEGHATGFRPQESDAAMGWPSDMDRGDLTTILWRDRRNVCILTNIHDAPAEGKFCSSNGKAIKPQIVVDYNRHMGYVDKGIEWQILNLSTIAHGSGQRNSSSICLTWPFWIATFFFSSLVGNKISHSDFRDTPLGNLLVQAGQEWNVQRPIGRPPAADTLVIIWRTWQETLAYSICHAKKMSCVCGQGCLQKC